MKPKTIFMTALLALFIFALFFMPATHLIYPPICRTPGAICDQFAITVTHTVFEWMMLGGGF